MSRDLSPILDAGERQRWLDAGPYRVDVIPDVELDVEHPTPFIVVDANGRDAGFGNFGERLGAEFCCASLNRAEAQAS